MNAIVVAAKRASLVTAATLAACSGISSTQPATSPNVAASALHARSQTSLHSWMDPRAKGQRLLYVSDTQNKAVYVFGGSSNTLVGTLTGFSRPMGECVDADNDVWIVDSDAAIEYAHGGTAPIGKIVTSYYNFTTPYSCAVDPLTHDIAIGINHSYYHDAGFVMVCASQSQCTDYQPAAAAYVSFVSYDKDGNLYADGVSRSRVFGLAVRPPGGRFKKLTIKGATITAPGALLNKFGMLSLGARVTSGGSVIYQVGSDGTVTGKTQLSGAAGCSQFAIAGNGKYARVTCPNSESANVTKYKYPAGGAPLVTLSGPFAKPFAAVYSNP